MPPPSSEFDQEMRMLEAELKRLEAEYNMFFAGRLPRLPWETRARVEAVVKRYDRMNLRNTAERFRFTTLQSRFQAFCDLWERHLKAKEEGRPIFGPRRVSAAPSSTAPAPAAAPAASKGDPTPFRGSRVVAVATIKDPAADQERLQTLYEQLTSARREAGEKAIPFEAFRQVVRAQVNKLGEGKGEVSFRVSVQDGKVTLTAKALKDSK
jgi:hypothetical protein